MSDETDNVFLGNRVPFKKLGLAKQPQNKTTNLTQWQGWPVDVVWVVSWCLFLLDRPVFRGAEWKIGVHGTGMYGQEPLNYSTAYITALTSV